MASQWYESFPKRPQGALGSPRACARGSDFMRNDPPEASACPLAAALLVQSSSQGDPR